MSRGWLIGCAFVTAALVAVPALAGPSGTTKRKKPPRCLTDVTSGQGQTFLHISGCNRAINDVQVKTPGSVTAADWESQSGKKTDSGNCKFKIRHINCAIRPPLQAKGTLLIGFSPQVEPGVKFTGAVFGTNGGKALFHYTVELTSGCSTRFFGTTSETQIGISGCQYPLVGTRLTFTAPENAAFTEVFSGKVIGQGTCGGGGTTLLDCTFNPPLVPGPQNSIILDVTPRCPGASPVKLDFRITFHQQTRDTPLVKFPCP